MSTTATRAPSARQRLLEAADELFYAEGIHTVGIDRIIARAGVAKASLYATFGSKDELVRCYLQSRYDARRARLTEGISARNTPRERLLAIFDVLGDSLARPTYRGCAFVNASAESPPGSVAEEVSNEYRAWVRSLFCDLARDAGVKDAEALSCQLLLLYDGAAVGARMDHSPGTADAARAAAETLLDAAS